MERTEWDKMAQNVCCDISKRHSLTHEIKVLSDALGQVAPAGGHCYYIIWVKSMLAFNSVS